MKEYFNEYYNGVTIWGYLPTLIILTVVYILLAYNLLGSNKSVVYAAILSWFFRVLIGFLAPLLSFFPSVTDADLFSKIISENFYPDYQSTGVKIFFYITYIIRILSLWDIQIFVLYQVFLYALSFLIIFYSFELWINHKGESVNSKTKIIYIFISTIYPASIMYISVPLREFLIIFAISIFTLGSVKWLIHKKDVGVLLLGAIIVLAVRPQLLPALLLSLFLIRFKLNFYNVLIIAIMPILLIYIFSVIFFDISPEKLSAIRASWSEMHAIEVYGVFDWHSWIDVVMDYPLLLLQYLLSPIPILHQKDVFNMIAASLDVIFLVPVYYCVILLLIMRNRVLISSPFMIISLVTILLSSLWEAYIGGAVRHRMISMLLLFPLVSFHLTYSNKKIGKD
ncbi:hypothetical protein [Aeromonas salmonicida]|uniref:hypothetical protein n=1 Tax=Aeromonas salmonicida TaxID=645 RepID=UPI00285FB4FF|nr:hypothetical protein [Aeromonas salmonicida]MDR7018917.1 hypothetical protein [Aeromonas salmonicida]